MNMSDMETKHVISPACDDAEYVREVAEAKRALELWTMEPGFRENSWPRRRRLWPPTGSISTSFR